MDFITKEKRSKIMKSIKSKDTKPEVILRKFLFNSGLRYRVNYKQLPGKPDIVFVSKKIAIFIHGCFWHQHGDKCEITNKPTSNTTVNKYSYLL
jgi:DNA mismatch endonuclease (patch repair protein)